MIKKQGFSISPAKILLDKEIKINQNLSIPLLSIREVLDYGEKEYWHTIAMLTANSYDFRVELFDSGKNYDEVSSYDIFIFVMTKVLKPEDYSFVIKGISPDGLEICRNKINGDIVLSDGKVIIDKAIYSLIFKILTTIHFIKKKYRHVGNAHFLEYSINNEKKRRERELQNKSNEFLYNSEIFNWETIALAKGIWNEESIQDVSLFLLLSIIRRLMKEKDFDSTMTGLYSGCLNSKDFTSEKMSSIHWTADLFNY